MKITLIYTREALCIITTIFYSNVSCKLKRSFGGTFGIFQFNHISAYLSKNRLKEYVAALFVATIG